MLEKGQKNNADTKNRYLMGFAAMVVLLALVRLLFPSVAATRVSAEELENDSTQVELAGSKTDKKTSVSSESMAKAAKDSIKQAEEIKKRTEEPVKQPVEPVKAEPIPLSKPSKFFNADGTLVKHRIWSVASYKEAFPDSQSVQYASARRWGVESVQNRQEAERRKRELVYVGSNPYFFVDKMNRSIPYLVPRAAVLLNDIGKAFFDSLQMKQVPLHKVIVTSVLRTKDDVDKLRNYNKNATENSCHLYGTTFDICYNRYKTVQDPDGPKRRQVQNDTLKWVLSEVLNDMRQNKRCYVKYEVKQGCYHITVR